jgi:hypothetical protein
MADLTAPKIATTIEDAMTAIAARTEADGDDWRVKVLRRPHASAPYESIAIFDGATAEQILSPEPWLSKFAGGSQFYMLRVVHAKDRGSDRPTAYYTLPAIPGQPTPLNMKIITQSEWRGPATLAYPTEDAPSKVNGAAKWPGSPSTQEVPRQTPTSADGGAGLLYAELQRERAKLEEERHQMVIDSIRRAADEDRKRLEAKFSDVLIELRTVKERPPEPERRSKRCS